MSDRLPLPPAWQRGLHLCALAALAIAQPLLDVLGRFATFFVAHGSGPLDLLLFVALVCVAVPLALVVLDLAARLAGRTVAAVVHLLLVAGLLAVLAMPPLVRAGLPPVWIMVGAGAAAAAGAFAYARWHQVRLFCTALSPAVLIVPAVFLFMSPARMIIRPERATGGPAVEIRAPAPIVFVLFDELSLLAMQDADGNIDASRFPNFAALARDAVWFRNATTVATFTSIAVPAILTGRLPDHNRIPNATEHPDNLFTLLEGRYDLRVLETVTHLCPGRLCPHDATVAPLAQRLPSLIADAALVSLHILLPPEWLVGLPDIQHQWTFQFQRWDMGRLMVAASSDRRAVFEQFLDSLVPTPRPTLYFLHILLPHSPYVYFPSGLAYDPPPLRFQNPGAAWLTDDLAQGSGSDQWILAQLQRRYLLQLSFVDSELGRLMARLRETGLYDDALLVVTADHGVCFRPNLPGRFVVDENRAEVMWVPLFIKAPHQRAGRVDDRNIETIDLLPTIAGMLGAEVPWRVDGTSLWDPNAAGRPEKTVLMPGKRSNLLDLVRKTYAPTRPENPPGAQYQRALLQAGPPLAQLIDPSYSGLLGQTAVASVPSPYRLILDNPERYDQVDVAARVLPAFITGAVVGPADGTPVPRLAVAVNGIIRAVAEPRLSSNSRADFAALVPESSFQPGRNAIEVFAVVGNSDGVTLQRVAPNAAAG